MQVSPVVTVNDQGQEVISDLSVSTNRPGVGRDGQVVNWQDDYVEDSEGRIHHMFENVELQSDRDDGIHFDEDAYVQALMDSNPDISKAQDWAVENLPEEWLDEYNKTIDTGNLDDLHKAVDWLMRQYGERTINEPEPDTTQNIEEDPEEPEMEELSEEETEILNNAVDNLERQEAMPEYVNDWQEQVELAQESGDETYAQVAAATAAFHAGQVTAEEAIDFCLSNCDLKDLARVYKMLS